MPIDPHLSEQAAGEDYVIDQAIGRLLRFGVLLAAAVILLGGILFLSKHATEPASFHTFRDLPHTLRSPLAILRSAFHGDPLSMMQLGVLLLIATPIARVALSVVAFAIQKDKLYAVISGIVLLLLLYGLLLR